MIMTNSHLQRVRRHRVRALVSSEANFIRQKEQRELARRPGKGAFA
jgi:hypothetical protein